MIPHIFTMPSQISNGFCEENKKPQKNPTQKLTLFVWLSKYSCPNNFVEISVIDAHAYWSMQHKTGQDTIFILLIRNDEMLGIKTSEKK